ncbi:MAG: SDR family oxidoreductase [Rhodobacteraceae bacterium]|nr:SDR family oxidoreductase [Paracoccaceae bacterium]
MPFLLSIGHGYTAKILSAVLSREPGWRIIGTTRNACRCAAVTGSGADCMIWPGDGIGEAIAEATHILISVPPDTGGDPVCRALGHLMASADKLVWVGYLSTTAVYGDRAGGWVNEEDRLLPSTRRGMARVRAEADWQALDLPLHIFRLAGIYGPGRGPLWQLQAGRKTRQVVREGQIFNRIHVADIASALRASMSCPKPGMVCNVADDYPCAPEEVADFAASLLGMDPLPRIAFAEADLSPVAKSFYAEAKRVSNRRLKRELGFRLRYPDYRSGLRSLLSPSRPQ